MIYISQVLKPVSALIIVDVQYDFIDGTLALRNCPAQQDGAEVVPVINKMLESAKFDVIIYSLDWHPSTHISFVDNIDKYPVCSSSQVSHKPCCSLLYSFNIVVYFSTVILFLIVVFLMTVGCCIHR